MRKKLETDDGIVEYFVLGNKNSSMTYLVTAGKHGNEPEGVVLVEKYLLPYLKENKYFDKQFVICPNLNPIQISKCLEAIKDNQSFDYCYQFRNNTKGINLNADYPTSNFTKDDGVPLQAKQTKLIIALQEEFSFGLMLDIHTNGKSFTNIYKYDEGTGQYLATEMSKRNSVLARDYVHRKNKGIVLLGTSGTYFGKERNVPILTIEFGARKFITTSFEEHCKNLWNLHKPAFRYLFQEVFPNENDPYYQALMELWDARDDFAEDMNTCGDTGMRAY